MTQLRYAIVDVFAEAPLHGNPAAIVFDADALDGASACRRSRASSICPRPPSS